MFKRRGEDVRAEAILTLYTIHGDATKLIPHFMSGLADANSRVRYWAEIGLGSFGAEAKAALPTLQEALQDPDKLVA